MSELSLQDSIWWIIPERLAGMRKPAESERDVLDAAGIGAIVSVMDDPGNLDWFNPPEFSIAGCLPRAAPLPLQSKYKNLSISCRRSLLHQSHLI